MTALRKTLLFGAFGAVAGLSASGIWEVAVRPVLQRFLFGGQSPQSQEPSSGSGAHATQVTDLLGEKISRVIEERRMARGAKAGYLEFSLVWKNKNDLDLHLIDPEGNEIYYRNGKCSENPPGEFCLDLDANAGAGPSSVDNPIEHIYLKNRGGGGGPSSVPAGAYRVSVDYYAHHADAPLATEYYVEILRRDEGDRESKQEFEGVLPGDSFQRPVLVHEFVMDNTGRIATPTVGSEAPSSRRTGSLETVVRLGTWAGALGGLLALFVAFGQNLYLRRTWLSPRDVSRTIVCLLAALLVGAIIGEVSYAFQAASGDIDSRYALVASWVLFGAIFGASMGLFIPNLRITHASLAGAAGGLIGSLLFFFLIRQTLGAVPGRVVHAAIIGFCLGLMVVIAESVFREAYLVISYGPKEFIKVNLGASPVVVGSAREANVFAPGAASRQYVFTYSAGKISCEDVISGRSEFVQPGATRLAGRVNITVRSANDGLTDGGSVLVGRNAPSVSTPMHTPSLRYRSNRISLLPDTKLYERDMPGLHPAEGDGVVARVVHHPTDPTKMGLRNSSTKSWSLITAQGISSIEVGKSVQLGYACRIRCDSFEAELLP